MSILNFENIIEDYLMLVAQGVHLLREKYGVIDLLQAWRKGSIPRCGQLSNNIEYEFHGVGCLLIFKDFDVNFDFGPDGRCDGFDEWRIQDYVSQRQDKYPNFSDKKTIQEAFDFLIKQNIIFCPKWVLSPHLYYFSSNLG